MKEKSTLKDVANNYLTHTVREKGITLIALIVTIIVLLILAGITIGAITGDNGIINQAQSAKTENERSDIEEQINVIVIQNSKDRVMDKNKLINDFEEKLPDGKEIVESDDLIYIIYPEYSFEVDIDSLEVAQVEIDKADDETPWELSGSGTEADPYLIESIEDLVAFSNNVNSGTSYNGKYVKLTRDLDFNLPFSYVNPKTKVSEKTNRIIEEDNNGTELKTFLTSGTGFNPIGGNKTGSFWGIFDGNGKVIKNIYINRPEEDYVALFGYSNGEIEKLGLTGNVTGGVSSFAYVGGIVGRSISTIRYCYNLADITSNQTNVFGIGKADIVEYCYNGGNIIAKGSSGGISNGDIKNSYNSGDVKGKYFIGGISSSFTVENCYNLGDVIGSEGYSYGIGGIVGTTQAKIRNCFSKGNVTGESTTQVGGIIGNTIDLDDENGESYIENNFYLIESARGGAGGIDREGAMPLPESEMPSVISVLMKDSVQVEWNGQMVDVWKEDTENINNGNPILFWQ